MYRVDTTEAAEKDILDAAKYIAIDLRNPSAADRLLTDVTEAILSLEEMPSRHAMVKDEFLASLGFRFFPVHNYIVFYIVREETKSVVVERFLYGRRDWAAILKSEGPLS